MGGVIGLCIPGGNLIPPLAVTLILGFIILLSCLKLQGGDFRQLNIKGLLGFWLGRFAMLPAIMYALTLLVAPTYSPAVLLLALTPAGTSSAAFTGLFGGNVAAALFITLLSSGAAIVLIPMGFAAAGIEGAAPPPVMLLVTLTQCVLLPALLAYPLRRVKAAVSFSVEWGKTITVLLLALMVFVIIAGQRSNILRDPATLPVPLLVAALCYAVFIAAGWLPFRASPGNRIAALTCSAYNNSGLSMALVLVGFAPKTVMTIVMAEVCWTLMPLATRKLMAVICAT